MTSSAPLPPIQDPLARARYQAALWTAVVTGAFTLAVSVLLATTSIHSATDDLENSTELAELRSALLQAPDASTADRLREEIRVRDYDLRWVLNHRQAFARTGGWLLVAGAVAFIIAAARTAAYRLRLPMPHPEPDEPRRAVAMARLARRSVAVLAAMLAVGGVTLGILVGGGVLSQPLTEGTQATARVFPSWAELTKQWPRFRGVAGTGTSSYDNIPTQWNAATGENILWKTEVPLDGLNSPIIWGDRIFMSGASVEKDEATGKILSDKREVYCFDAATGQLLWKKPVETAASKSVPPPKISDVTSYAASTMVTDGQAVFAIFPNGDVASFDFSGRQLWTRCVGPLANKYGHASSLELYKGRLLVLLDQGEPGKTRSVLLALDAATGKTVWEVKRGVPASWASPIVIHTDKGDQFITAASPWVIAYNPDDGTELWRANVLDGDIGPSPTYAGGKVYAVNVGAKLASIRTDGRGDVTGSAVDWTAEEGLPDICSPLADGKLVWLLTTEGKLTCYNAADGKQIYKKEFESPDPDIPVHFKSSPALAGDKVYLTEERGVTHILSAGDSFKEIGTAVLGEEVDASLVFQDGRIYIRGKHHLFAIGKK
jgi:outer membrane protein assembly factor BamB